jgi:hypothetical protein
VGSTNDIQIKAKNGIRVGDIQNEAHLAFVCGYMSEQQKKFENAIKFYKRFFFCAKLLDDQQGTEIALNKMGVNYFLMGHFDKSMSFHCKHQSFLEANQKSNMRGQMISLYNSAICMRNTQVKNLESCQFGGLAASMQLFQQSLAIAEELADSEHKAMCKAQMGILQMLKNSDVSDLNAADECF